MPIYDFKGEVLPKTFRENYPFKSLASLLSVTAVPLVNLSKGHTSVWAVIKTEVYRQCKSIEFQLSVNQLQWMSKSAQLTWNWKPLLVILIRLPLKDCGIKRSVKLCVKWKRWFTVLVDAGSCKRKFGKGGTAWHENEVLANSSPNFNCCWLITWEPAKNMSSIHWGLWLSHSFPIPHIDIFVGFPISEGLNEAFMVVSGQMSISSSSWRWEVIEMMEQKINAKLKRDEVCAWA